MTFERKNILSIDVENNEVVFEHLETSIKIG